MKVSPFVPGISPPMPLNSTLTVFGKRRSGKSVWLRWLVFEYLRPLIPYYYAYTYTKHNSFLEAFMPSAYVFTDFKSETLRALMDKQKEAVLLYLKHFDDEKFKDRINPRIAVFWDDYNGKDVTFNDTLKDYYYTGRHYQTFNIFNAQYVKLVPPAVRSNTDYAILFNTDYMGNLEEYHHSYAGKMDKHAFYTMFRKYTEEVPYGFLCINNDPNIPYDEKFFSGVASELPVDLDHVVGCALAWKGNIKQLKEIADGSMQKRLDRIKNISNPEGDLKIEDDSSSLKSGVWDTSEYRPYSVGEEAERAVAPRPRLHDPLVRRFIQSPFHRPSLFKSTR